MGTLLADLSLRLRSLTAARGGAVRLAAILLLPALGALVLVIGFAPAIGSADRIPVAVVNLDEGSRGRGLVDSLYDTAELDWHEVGEHAAKQGLADGSYALALTIPRDYTEKVESVSGDDPQKAILEVDSDGAGNVLATKAGGAVLRQVQARLRGEVGRDYLLSVLNDVRGQATKLTVTSDGAVMLDQGFDGLSKGADGLSQGLGQTAEGAGKLADGLGQIAAGATALGDGGDALSAGLAALSEQGVAPLSQGAQALSSGLGAVSGAVKGIGAGASANARIIGAVEASVESGYEGLRNLGIDGANGSADGAQVLPAGLSQALDQGKAALGEAAERADGALAAADEALGGVDAAAVADARDKLATASGTAASAAKALSSDDRSSPGARQRLDAAAAAADDIAARVKTVLASETSTLSADDRAALEAAVAAATATAESSRSVAGDVAQAAGQAQEASTAASDAAGGLTSLDVATPAIDAARKELASARTGIADGSRGISDLVERLKGAWGSVQQVAGSVAGSHAILAGYEQAAGMSLSASTAALGTGASQVADQLGSEGAVGAGARGLAAGVSALGQAMGPLAQGAGQLGAGARTLGTALEGVSGGASGLAGALSTMAGASGQLGSGVSQLRDATGQVAKAMDDVGSALSDASSHSQDRARVASGPVSLATDQAHPTGSDAAGIAPAIAPLALWFGALATALALPAVDRRALFAGRVCTGALAPFAPWALAALVQATALLVALAAVGSFSSGPAAALSFAVLAVGGVAFAAVAYLLKVLGRRAGLVAFALLGVLQAVVAGTVLPASLAATGPLAALGGALPVPLVATALRGAVAGSGAGVAAGLGACAAVTVACVALAVLAASSRRDVRPERVFGVS